VNINGEEQFNLSFTYRINKKKMKEIKMRTKVEKKKAADLIKN
jgi:hypothetical protein